MSVQTLNGLEGFALLMVSWYISLFHSLLSFQFTGLIFPEKEGRKEDGEGEKKEREINKFVSHFF